MILCHIILHDSIYIYIYIYTHYIYIYIYRHIYIYIYMYTDCEGSLCAREGGLREDVLPGRGPK